MLLSKEEQAEIRRVARAEVYHELAEIEYNVTHCAGSYEYLCEVAGDAIFTHKPIGAVLRTIPHVLP